MADSAMGVDGAGFIEGDLCAHQSIRKTSGVNGERGHVARNGFRSADRFGVGVAGDGDFEHAVSVLIWRAVDECNKVGFKANGWVGVGHGREHDPGQVNACGWSLHLAEVNVLGEES